MRAKLFRPPWLIRTFYKNRVWSIPSPDSVFLTFDDGPTETTQWVLDFLQSENIKATFFCVGENVQENSKLFERILNEGHSIGNHTKQHLNSNQVSSETFIQDLSEAASYIRSDLFRPPYGRMDLITGGKILKRGYKIIMWTWLSYDFDKDISNETILDKSKQIKSGDILVFHDNQKNKERIKSILPLVVKEIKSKNLDFKPISF